MILRNFKVAGDHIALEYDGVYLDLHNNYQFVGLEYRVSQREIHMNWTVRPEDDRVSRLPENLRLSLHGVYLFKAGERNPEMPFTEDDCLSFIGFMWDELIGEMGGFASNAPKDGSTHMVLGFMSSFSLKIGAESAEVETWSETHKA